MSKVAHIIYLTVIAILGAAVIWLVCDAPMDTVQKTEAGLTISSIAVLPFYAFGTEDPAKQVAQTITSRLIESLGNKPHLKVAPERETREFADTDISIREIGDQLSVSTILEGAVRKTDDRVRVTIQLIDARTGAHLWSESYDRNIGDLDSIVADVERTIAALAPD